MKSETPLIQQKLDIARRIHVAVEIEVAVSETVTLGGVIAERPGPLRFGYGAAVGLCYLRNPLHTRNVGAAPRLGVEHGPDGACPTDYLAIAVEDAEISLGKEPVYRAHPGLNLIEIVDSGIDSHLHGNARQHPGLVKVLEVCPADAKFVGMKRGYFNQPVNQQRNRHTPLWIALGRSQEIPFSERG